MTSYPFATLPQRSQAWANALPCSPEPPGRSAASLSEWKAGLARPVRGAPAAIQLRTLRSPTPSLSAFTTTTATCLPPRRRPSPSRICPPRSDMRGPNHVDGRGRQLLPRGRFSDLLRSSCIERYAAGHLHLSCHTTRAPLVFLRCRCQVLMTLSTSESYDSPPPDLLSAADTTGLSAVERVVFDGRRRDDGAILCDGALIVFESGWPEPRRCPTRGPRRMQHRDRREVLGSRTPSSASRSSFDQVIPSSTESAHWALFFAPGIRHRRRVAAIVTTSRCHG